MANKDEEDLRSAPIRLLDLVWRNVNDVTDHSWERVNHSMHDALTLAIGAGFRFSLGDVNYIQENYRSGYWIGESWEWTYSFAILVGNKSFVDSFESRYSRTPFIADDVDCGNWSQGFLHRTGTRQRERLSVGAKFPWKGHQVTVTSFAGDGLSLVACSYRREPEDSTDCLACHRALTWPKEAIAKRFRISREDIIVDRADRKERAELRERIAAADPALRSAVLAELAVSTEAAFNALPTEKIRAVVERILPQVTKKRATGKVEK